MESELREDMNRNGRRRTTSPRPGFWAKRLTNLYTVGASGAAKVGTWWWRRSERWSEEGIAERRGEQLPPATTDYPIWIHGASMGEARIGGYFAEALRDRGQNVIASAMTETGLRVCESVYPSGTPCFRVPFDLPGPMKSAFQHFNPRALVLVETEWWPNFLITASEHGVPVFVVNGRISAGAFQRYRLGAPYWRSLLKAVRFFFMRSDDDAERIRALGVEPWRVRSAGSLKVPVHFQSQSTVTIPTGLGDSRPVWIAGCTRPGEEKIVLDTFRLLRDELEDLQLWIAPRHPERLHKVERAVRRARFSMMHWTDGETADSSYGPDVVLIDRMGILSELYRFATVAFVGGSLRPYGGHNPLEPAAFGVPVVFGPHMEEQRDAADALLESGMATVAEDAGSLRVAVAQSLLNPLNESQRSNRADQLRAQLLGVRDDIADDLCAMLASMESRDRPVTTTDDLSSEVRTE